MPKLLRETNDLSSTSANRSDRLSRLKVELHKQLISGMDMRLLSTISPENLVAQLRDAAAVLCQAHPDLLTRTERDQLIDELVDETVGLGPLEPLLNDTTISDILINGPHNIYVERRGKLQKSTCKFRDLDHLVEIVQRIVGRVGRRIDESSPMVDARLPDGGRLNAVIYPLAIEGALVSIRRSPGKPLAAGDLLRQESVSREMLNFLAACVQAGLNIIVSGGTGAGKTTLLNALSGFIRPSDRIVTIEDAAELQLQQPHVAKMETRPPNLDGRGEITTRDLLRNSLRMRPDRIIIGECRGSETFDMLQAMNTGHDGGMTTIHANDARDAMTRLSMLAAMAAPELPLDIIKSQIASAVDIIVQVTRLPCGRRRVTQISEITGTFGTTINLHDVFLWSQTGIDADGRSVGSFRSSGIIPDCLELFKSKGINLTSNIFDEGDNSRERIDYVWGGTSK